MTRQVRLTCKNRAAKYVPGVFHLAVLFSFFLFISSGLCREEAACGPADGWEIVSPADTKPNVKLEVLSVNEPVNDKAVKFNFSNVKKCDRAIGISQATKDGDFSNATHIEFWIKRSPFEDCAKKELHLLLRSENDKEFAYAFWVPPSAWQKVRIKLTGLTETRIKRISIVSFAADGAGEFMVSGLTPVRDKKGFFGLQDCTTVTGQSDIYKVELHSASGVILCGDSFSILFPRAMKWETDFPVVEYKIGERAYVNRDYAIKATPLGHLAGTKMTMAAVDASVTVNVRFPETVQQATLYVILHDPRKKDSVSLELIRSEFRCQRITSPLVLDGKDDEEVWKRADCATGFISFADGVTAAEIQSEVKTAYDENNLYIFCRGYRPGGKPVAWQVREHDGKIWKDDSFEFLIRPKGMTEDYFQLDINGAGAVYDSANHLTEEADLRAKSVVTRDPSWNSSASVATQADERGWTAEIAIPLKALNASNPVPGDAWGFNVTRLAGDLEETSVWGKVPFEGLHSTGSFVPVTMATDISATGNKISFLSSVTSMITSWEISNFGKMAGNGISGSKKGVLGNSGYRLEDIGGKSYIVTAKIASKDKGLGRVIVTYEDNRKRQWKIYLFEKARPPAPNARMEDLLYFPSDAERITSVVIEKTNAEGEFGMQDICLIERGLRFDHYVRVLDPYLTKDIYLPEENEAFMALPLNRIAVSTSRRLPAFFILRANYKLITRTNLNFKLFFDLPEGVQISRAGIPAYPSGSDGFSDPESLGKPVERPEGKYRRYMFSKGPAWFPRFSGNRTPLLLLVSTSWKSGEKGKLFYWVEWNGGKQEEREAMIEAIDIPKAAGLCKLFKTGISILLPISPGLDAIKVWPEMASDLKYFGINTVEFFELPPVDFLEEKKALVALMQKEGFNVAVGGSFPSIAYVNAVRRGKKKEIQGIDIDGNVHLRKGDPVPCPSYRGAEYEQSMKYLRDVVAQFGVDQLYFDEEFFKMGNKVCYCDRCLDGFGKWFKAKNPGAAYISPKDFMKDRGSHSELVSAWLWYKSRLVADGWVGEARSIAQAALKAGGSDKKVFIALTGHLSGNCLENNFHDPNYLIESGLVDAFLPMPYYYFSRFEGSVAAAADEVAYEQNRFFKDKPPVVLPYISTGETGFGQYFEPQSGIQDQIFEMALSGCVQGVVHFYFHAMDGYQFKAMAEAFNAIAKVEDIILKGTKVTQFKSDCPTVRLRAIKSGNRLVLLASEYSYNQIDARVTLAGFDGWRVTDLMTDEQIGKSDDNGSFNLRISDVRARLLKLEK